MLTYLLSHLVLLGVIVIVVFVLFLLILSFFGIIFLFLLAFFHLTQLFPFLREAICFGSIICNDNVVKDRSALHLPQIEADKTKIAILVNAVVILILWICNLFRFPEAFVRWIRDALSDPFAFEFWIVLHRSFPFAILLIVPIVWLLRLAVNNSFLFHPIIWFLRLWVVDHGIIYPIVGLLVIWVTNLFGFQNLPILLQRPVVNFLLIDIAH